MDTKTYEMLKNQGQMLFEKNLAYSEQFHKNTLFNVLMEKVDKLGKVKCISLLLSIAIYFFLFIFNMLPESLSSLIFFTAFYGIIAYVCILGSDSLKTFVRIIASHIISFAIFFILGISVLAATIYALVSPNVPEWLKGLVLVVYALGALYTYIKDTFREPERLTVREKRVQREMQERAAKERAEKEAQAKRLENQMFLDDVRRRNKA